MTNSDGVSNASPAAQTVSTATDATVTAWDHGYAERDGKPFFWSLWSHAWGDAYSTHLQPFSSCTWTLVEQMAEDLALSPGQVLLDLGCGTGGVGLWFAQTSGVQLRGVDHSARAIALAKRRAGEWSVPDVSFDVGTFESLPVASASVDAVISVDALPFAEDPDAALEELRRVLRPGGRFVFTARESRRGTPRYETLGPAWSRALRRHGFTAANVRERSEVSDLWRTLFTLTIESEAGLRSELAPATVDHLLSSARASIPKLADGRPWLSLTAVRD